MFEKNDNIHHFTRECVVLCQGDNLKFLKTLERYLEEFQSEPTAFWKSENFYYPTDAIFDAVGIPKVFSATTKKWTIYIIRYFSCPEDNPMHHSYFKLSRTQLDLISKILFKLVCELQTFPEHEPVKKCTDRFALEFWQDASVFKVENIYIRLDFCNCCSSKCSDRVVRFIQWNGIEPIKNA